MNSSYWKACQVYEVILTGHFLLRSKRHSNIYGQKDAIYRHPVLYKRTIDNLIHLVEDHAFNAVTGPAVAGIALAAPIALHYDKVFTYPEKKDGEMVFRKVYQDALRGKMVLLVEDVITTGGSVMKTIDAVYRAGGGVVLVACIWNRTGWGCEVPVLSIVDTKAESWEPLQCPMCKEGLELKDPKGE